MRISEFIDLCMEIEDIKEEAWGICYGRTFRYKENKKIHSRKNGVWGGLSNKEVSTSAPTRRAHWSDATTFEQSKRIFFMLISKTWFKVEEFRLE